MELRQHRRHRLLGTVGIDQRTWKLVNNLQANYQASDRSQWSIYYGSKYARFVFDSGAYQGYTDLIGSEYRYDLSPRWDIGVIGSRLHTYSSGVYSNSYGIETGWADGSRLPDTMAHTYGQYDGSNSTAFGDNFSRFLQSVGAPGGILSSAPSGSVPASWPRW